MKRLHLIVLLGVTGATMAFVAAGLPGLSQVPGWFYHPVQRGLGEAWPVAVGGVVVPALVWAGFRLAHRRRFPASVLGMTAASFVAQLMLLWADADGLEAAWRWQHQGHGEMSRIADARRDRWRETLLDYEALVDRRELGVFAPSKPPGTLGVYMAIHGLADWVDAERRLGAVAEGAARDPRVGERAGTAALTLFLFPLVAALLIPLLYTYGTVLLGSRPVALAAAVLWSFVPAVLLIQHHLDGVLYPFLAVLACTLAAVGMRRRAPWWTVVGGLAYGASLYFSFSLVPVVGLALGTIAFMALAQGALEGRAATALRAAWHGVAFLGGAVASLWVLWWVADFHFAQRLVHALDYHAYWKRGVPTWPWRGWSLLELALYVGFPLVAAFLLQVVRSAMATGVRRLEPIDWLAPGVMAYLVVLALASGTNEVARLWLFVVPFVALAVAAAVRQAARGDRWYVPVGWLAACQGVVTLVLKANQVW
jgi:hypothetical protein